MEEKKKSTRVEHAGAMWEPLTRRMSFRGSEREQYRGYEAYMDIVGPCQCQRMDPVRGSGGIIWTRIKACQEVTELGVR